MSSDDAFEAGYDAYWGGADPDDNPFKPETADQRAWQEGQAQAPSEDDNPGEGE